MASKSTFERRISASKSTARMTKPPRLQRPWDDGVWQLPSHLNALDPYGLNGAVTWGGLPLCDLIHDVHPVGNLSEDRILTVQGRRHSVHDKKLTARTH